MPVGTTGESPTLDMEEHIQVIRTVIEAASGRVKVIAGSGGNSTAEALELTTLSRDAGADGTLQVTPYYNKPTQAGLIRTVRHEMHKQGVVYYAGLTEILEAIERAKKDN